jgi:hypothetical protein
MPAPHTLAALLADPQYRDFAIGEVLTAFRRANGRHYKAAKLIGVQSSTLYGWRERFPELDDAVAALREKHGFSAAGGRPKRK